MVAKWLVYTSRMGQPGDWRMKFGIDKQKIANHPLKVRIFITLVVNFLLRQCSADILLNVCASLLLLTTVIGVCESRQLRIWTLGWTLSLCSCVIGFFWVDIQDRLTREQAESEARSQSRIEQAQQCRSGISLAQCGARVSRCPTSASPAASKSS